MVKTHGTKANHVSFQSTTLLKRQKPTTKADSLDIAPVALALSCAKEPIAVKVHGALKGPTVVTGGGIGFPVPSWVFLRGFVGISRVCPTVFLGFS